MGESVGPTTRLSGELAFGRMTQDDAFLPPTQNALLKQYSEVLLAPGERLTGAQAPFAVRALAAGLGANVGSVAPMTALGVDDPREWSASSWLSDLVPHLAYGVVTALVFEKLDHR